MVAPEGDPQRLLRTRLHLEGETAAMPEDDPAVTTDDEPRPDGETVAMPGATSGDA